MMDLALDQRVYAITGGFGALGSAYAGVLSERGARVALLDRTEPRTAACSACLTLSGTP